MSRICLSLSIPAALLASTALADVPRVAADIAPVHSLVSRVMDGVGAPDLVIPAGASPHEYSLRPSEAGALQDADVVFWMGEDLSPWLANAIETLADDAKVAALLEADGTELLDFRESALFEAHVHGDHEGHDDHGHGDHGDHAGHDHDHDHDHAGHDHKDHDHADHASHEDHGHNHGHDHDHDHAEHSHDAHDHDDHAHHDHAHGAHDPHAWLSLANAQTWLDLIAAELSVADPENAGTYFANAAAAKAEMDQLATEVTEILAPAKGGQFIVFHDAYQYFETTFDFPAAGAISLSDARDPSPARIAEIQGRIENEGIDCVLSEPQFNPDLVATVLDGAQAQTAVIDPLGSDLTPGGDLYPQLIRNLATALAGCMTPDT